jgi:hypothetical protein
MPQVPTSCLLTTALLAVRRHVVEFHWIDLDAPDLDAMLVALTVGMASVQLGFEALDSATGK